MTATRTKRILSIQPVAERGGSDRALARLVGSLAHAGWDCHIALPASSPMAADFEAAGATLHVIPMRRITTSGSRRYWLAYAAGWPVAVARLSVLARRLDAGVIHSNSLHCWYGWAAALVVRRPHVWHAREIVVQSGAALRLERVLTRHFADTVVAVSAAVAAQFDSPNVVVRYDQVDAEEFHPGRAGAFRAHLDLPDDAAVVGAAGRIDTWKGIEVLLDAVPEMQTLRPGLQVVIAGAPVVGKEAYARRLADRAAAMAGVHWLGPRDDIADVIADLDVLVLPSTEAEPFGLAVIEALASGVPVVATAAGGPVEILGATASQSGRLIPPGDSARLAAATVELLPPGPSSTAQRRLRPVLATAMAAATAAATATGTGTGDLPGVFESALRGSEGPGPGPGPGPGHSASRLRRRRRPRRPGGTGRLSRRRSGPR